MFSFAKNFVKTLEQSAESIITTSSNLINTETDPYFQAAGTSFGYRVLHVEKDSVAQLLGLEPWFDYIVGINNHELLTSTNSNGFGESGSKDNGVPDFNLFIREIENCVNQPVSFNVWNAKGGILRQVQVAQVEPFENHNKTVYNKEGLLVNEKQVVTNNKFKTLGATVQATPLITATYVYHVLEIQPNSPAEQGGLIPHSDYIIGANDGLFATGGEDLFSRVINSIYHRNPDNCQVELFVYNHDFDLVRPVTIQPGTHWGGNGIVGCGVGYGYLHRLPQVVGKFEDQENSSTLFNPADQINPTYLQPPGHTLFNIATDANTSTEFIPAQVTKSEDTSGNGTPASLETPSAGVSDLTAPPVGNRRKKKHAAQAPDFTDYFNEEIAKSEKLDNRKTSVTTDTLPPPPKKH